MKYQNNRTEGFESEIDFHVDSPSESEEEANLFLDLFPGNAKIAETKK